MSCSGSQDVDITADCTNADAQQRAKGEALRELNGELEERSIEISALRSQIKCGVLPLISCEHLLQAVSASLQLCTTLGCSRYTGNSLSILTFNSYLRHRLMRDDRDT